MKTGYEVKKEKSLLTGETKWVVRYNGERIGGYYSKAEANATVKWHQSRVAKNN